MIRVVLDTNVVVSALLGSKGLEERVLKLALHRKVRLYVSTPILEEYEQVLLSPRLGLRHSLVRSSLRRIQAAAHAVHPRTTVTACSHGEDNRFIECAETGGGRFPDHRKPAALPPALETDHGCQCPVSSWNWRVLPCAARSFQQYDQEI